MNEITPDDNEAVMLAPMVNSVGNLGGLVGPVLVGLIKERTRTYRPALIALAISTVAAIAPLCSVPTLAPPQDGKRRRKRRGTLRA